MKLPINLHIVAMCAMSLSVLLLMHSLVPVVIGAGMLFLIPQFTLAMRIAGNRWKGEVVKYLIVNELIILMAAGAYLVIRSI